MEITAKTVLRSANRLEVEVNAGDRTEILFFESNEALWDKPPETDDFAAVALCQYCSSKKADLFIDGTLTQSILYNLDEFLKIWSNWRPDLFSQISIRAKNVVKDSPGIKKPAVIAFSGGVDACFSLVAHQTRLLGASSREIGLGVLIVGFDLRHGEAASIDTAYEGAKKALASFGVGCAIIETNWQQDFCPDWLMGFAAGVSCVLQTLAGQYSAGILSSSFNYLQELKMKPHGSHMMINHFLGSYGFPIVTTGGTHTRIERIGVIKDYPELINNLRVCWQTDGKGSNCGVCEKCVRTRLEMMISHIEPDIFLLPMGPEHIKKMDLSYYIPFRYFEDIYLHFPKDHPLYGVVEETYLRDTNDQNNEASLVNRINAKNKEISLLKEEMNAIRNSRSYKLMAPLRFVRKFFKRTV